MQIGASPPDRVRVIGALTGAALETLFEMLKTTKVLLDLSQVREAEADAVQLLARLAPERCDQLASPKWLALRIEMERRSVERASRMNARLRAARRLSTVLGSRVSLADGGAAPPARGRP